MYPLALHIPTISATSQLDANNLAFIEKQNFVDIRRIVADPKALEQPFFVEIIDDLQRDLVWDRAVRAVKVPHFQRSSQQV